MNVISCTLKRAGESVSKKTGKLFFAAFCLIVFVACFSYTRLTILYGSTKIFFGADEQLIGMLPLHLERGLLIPFYKYQYEEHQGGAVPTGLVAYPFFRFFGPSYFSLKMSSFTFSFLLFLFLFILLLLRFGQTEAAFLCVVFLCAPFYYLQQSQVAYGNHMELATLYAGVLCCLFGTQLSDSLTKPPVARSVVMLFLTGVLSGFCMYFDYTSMIFVPFVVGFLFLAVRTVPDFFLAALIFIAGFRVGLIPWYAFHTGGSFLNNMWHFAFQGNPSPGSQASHNDPMIFLRAVTVNFLDWYESPDWLVAGRFIRGRILNWSIFSVLVGSYVYMAVRCRKTIRDVFARLLSWRRTGLTWSGDHVILFALIYLPIHLVVYALYVDRSPKPLPPHRYLLPLFLFHFLLISAAIADLWKNKMKPVALAGLALVIFAGAGGYAGIMREAKLGESLARPGYSSVYFSGSMLFHYKFDIDETALYKLTTERFAGREEDYYSGFFCGIAAYHGVDVSGHWDAAQKRGEESMREFATGIGSACAVLKKKETPPPISVSFDADAFREEFLYGIELAPLLQNPASM